MGDLPTAPPKFPFRHRVSHSLTELLDSRELSGHTESSFYFLVSSPTFVSGQPFRCFVRIQAVGSFSAFLRRCGAKMGLSALMTRRLVVAQPRAALRRGGTDHVARRSRRSGFPSQRSKLCGMASRYRAVFRLSPSAGATSPVLRSAVISPYRAPPASLGNACVSFRRRKARLSAKRATTDQEAAMPARASSTHATAKQIFGPSEEVRRARFQRPRLRPRRHPDDSAGGECLIKGRKLSGSTAADGVRANRPKRAGRTGMTGNLGTVPRH